MFFHLSTYDISRSSLSLLFSYLFPFCYASFHSLREAKRRGEERTEELSDEWKESVKGMERRRPGSSILEDSFYLSVSPLFGSLSIRPVCRGSVRFSLFTFPLHSLRSWRMEWGTEARVRSRVWRVEWGTAGRCGEEGREPAKRREWETPGSDQPLSHSLPFVSRSFGVLSGSLRFPSVPLSDRAPKDEGREWGKGKEPRTRRCAHDFLFSSLTHLSHLSHRRPA